MWQSCVNFGSWCGRYFANAMDPAPLASPSGDPVLAALARIEARLGALESRLQPALDVVAEAPAAIGTAIDMADDVAARLGDVDERLRAALSLAERLSAPQTLAQLHEAITMAEQLPGLVATGIDIADAAFDSARAAGVDVGRLVPALQAVTLFWAKTLTSSSTSTLLSSPQTAAQMAALLSAATAALQTTTQAPPTSVSAFGALRALGDPAVQRSLGLLLTFARAFGEALAVPKALPSPTSS